MRTMLLGLLMMLISLLSSCSSVAAGNGRDARDSLYFRDPPQELSRSVETKLADFRKNRAVSDDVATGMRKTVDMYDATKPATLQALRDEAKRERSAIISIVGESLATQDDKAREKAILALRCTLEPEQNLPKEGDDADSLSAALLYRAIFDRSADVRESAMIGLRNLAISRKGNARITAVKALEEAQGDPDPDIRHFAEECCRAVRVQ